MISELVGNSSFAASGISRPMFMVTSQGVPLPESLLGAIVSASINLAVDQQGTFSFEVNDPKLLWIERANGLLGEGRDIEISLGYGRKLQRMISGVVTAVGAELDDGGGLTIQVDGHDALNRAASGNAFEQFLVDESDHLILTKIAGTVLGLSISLDIETERAMKQKSSGARGKGNISTMAFIGQLAREYGCNFWVEDKVLYFCRERPGIPIILRRRANLTSFSVRMSTAGQVAAVEARAWDTVQAEQIIATSKATSSKAYADRIAPGALALLSQGDAAKRVLFAGMEAGTREEAQRQADAEMLRLRRRLVTADGTTIGNPDIRVGSVVMIVDMGRFSGEYLVQSVRHIIGQNGYSTSFNVSCHV